MRGKYHKHQILQRSRLRARLLILAVLCLPALGFGASALDALLEPPPRPDGFEYQNVDTVVAIGDVHGAIEPLRALLRGLKLVDEADRWTGGTTHLVSLGDLIDRGDATQAVLELFMRLQQEAIAAGGAVHVLLGNHEMMNLTGDWRDVSDGDLASFAQDDVDAETARREAFYRFGRYGSWLLQRPLLLKINNRLYTHGGLSSLLLEGPLDAANDTPKNLLKAMVVEAESLVREGLLPADARLLELTPQPQSDPPEDPGLRRLRGMASSPFFADFGPLWYRGTSGCEATIESDLTQSVLAHFDADSVVVGHTPSWNHRVRRLQDGRVWAIDTGMLKSAYRGEPRALRIQGDQVEVLDERGAAVGWSDELFAGATAEALNEMQQQWATYTVDVVAEQPDIERPRQYRKDRLVQVVDAAGTDVAQGWFRKLGKGAVRRELAAWHLDRMLGLGMVPETFPAQLGKDRGVVMLMDSAVLHEQQRLEQERVFNNWCEHGNSYQAVTVFDSLINQRERNTWNLAYEHRLTKLRLTDHGDSFGGASKPAPTNATPALSETLRDRLSALTREDLDAQLGELLSKREIKALLRRRDVIVQWPGLPGA